MKSAVRTCILGLALQIAMPAVAGQPIAAVHPGSSATKSRDIQGFTLGMPIREAMKRVTLTYRQDDQIQGKVGDTDITFEICPSGSVYFIETNQPLGRFMVDKAFLDTLNARLFAKYGHGDGAPDNLEWDLVEPVRYTTGEVRPFKTNWMSALVNSDSDGVSLNLKMLDFRICWADYERANRRPSSTAGKAVRL